MLVIIIIPLQNTHYQKITRRFSSYMTEHIIIIIKNNFNSFCKYALQEDFWPPDYKCRVPNVFSKNKVSDSILYPIPDTQPRNRCEIMKQCMFFDLVNAFGSMF